MIKPQDFSMFAGDSLDIDIPLPGRDLTGVSVSWVLKRSVLGELLVTKSISNGITVTEGLVTVKLDPADTASLKGGYYYAAKLKDASLKENTMLTGYITIVPSGI